MYLIKNIHVYAPEDVGIKDVLVDEKIIKIGDNLPVIEEYDIEIKNQISVIYDYPM